jgi:hypothetical protein
MQNQTNVQVRSALVLEAIGRVGRKGQSLALTNAFDFITKDITVRGPFLFNTLETYTPDATYNYIVLPDDYRNRDAMIVGERELGYVEPNSFHRYYQSSDVSEIVAGNQSGQPNWYTVDKRRGKIYFWPMPDDDYYVYFRYGSLHPKAGYSLTFTSGGPEIPLVGEAIVQGAASGTISGIIVNDGTWEDGTAEGILIFPSLVGAFAAGELTLGGHANNATIAAASATADNFKHFLGCEFDETIINGLCWKACHYISDLQESEPFWKGQYMDSLQQMADLNIKYRIAFKGNLWQPSWE